MSRVLGAPELVPEVINKVNTAGIRHLRLKHPCAHTIERIGFMGGRIAGGTYAPCEAARRPPGADGAGGDKSPHRRALRTCFRHLFRMQLGSVLVCSGSQQRGVEAGGVPGPSWIG